MANYYARTAGNDTTGDGSHALPWRTVKKATDTVTAGLHHIFCENVTLDAPTVTTTYTIAAGVSLYSTSDTTNDPPTSIATGAGIVSTTAGVSINVQGDDWYAYGLLVQTTAATNSTSIGIGNVSDNGGVAEACTFNNQSTSTSSSILVAGGLSAGHQGKMKTKGCTFVFGSTGQPIAHNGRWESQDDIFAVTGSVPSPFIEPGVNAVSAILTNPTMTNLNGTLVAGTSSRSGVVKFINGKLATSYTALGSTTSDASSEVFIINSAGAAGDPASNYGSFAHYNHRGNTVANFSVYQTTGASYDGTNYYSWVVTGTNATFARPYCSPWFGTWHTGTSAITPRIEVLRDGSTTAYTDKQVWGEWTYQGTSGYPLALTVSDRCGLVAAAANQGTSALGAGDWTGETTPWYGKLEPTATITPVEKGHLTARVCVGDAIAIYVTPKLFGLS